MYPFEYPIYWLSIIVYPILVVVFFTTAKLLKYNFTYKIVALLSVVTGLISYVAFTFLSMWLPVMLTTGASVETILYIIGELIGFLIGILFWTLIVYWIGRSAHMKLKTKKKER